MATNDGEMKKGMETAPLRIERDCMNRPLILDGLFPEEAHMKDEGELLLEVGEWKKNDMFFEYRIKASRCRLVRSLPAPSLDLDPSPARGWTSKTKALVNEKVKAGEYTEAAEGALLKDKGNEKFKAGEDSAECICPQEEGADLKDKGNEKFKAGEYAEAAVFYRKGLYYASFDDSQFNFELHDTHRVQVVAVVVPLKLNYALCLLKDS
ncbi:hypothetical protein T484DRAFT_1793004 [Baffinella frigidus]|nr:hypothetical protein T484DRAFT_1793004 [Cryptophyta sp. CCMP2293]